MQVWLELNGGVDGVLRPVSGRGGGGGLKSQGGLTEETHAQPTKPTNQPGEMGGRRKNPLAYLCFGACTSFSSV